MKGDDEGTCASRVGNSVGNPPRFGNYSGDRTSGAAAGRTNSCRRRKGKRAQRRKVISTFWCFRAAVPERRLFLSARLSVQKKAISLLACPQCPRQWGCAQFRAGRP